MEKHRRTESNSTVCVGVCACAPYSAVVAPKIHPLSLLPVLSAFPLQSFLRSLVMLRLAKLASMLMQTTLTSMPTVHPSQQCIRLLFCQIHAHAMPMKAVPAVCPFLVFASMSYCSHPGTSKHCRRPCE